MSINWPRYLGSKVNQFKLFLCLHGVSSNFLSHGKVFDVDFHKSDQKTFSMRIFPDIKA